MAFVAGILTALLVLNCLVLILLVLIQLPKKDAGAGMAFGGGAADALFGAGSGNALTKITKYATVIFFLLALFLGYLEDQLYNKNSASEFEKQVQQKQTESPVAMPPALPATRRTGRHEQFAFRAADDASHCTRHCTLQSARRRAAKINAESRTQSAETKALADLSPHSVCCSAFKFPETARSTSFFFILHS